MHTLSVIALLLLAVLAIEARPRYYSRRISRPMSRPFTQSFDISNSRSMGYPSNNYISLPGGLSSVMAGPMRGPMPFNYPMQFGHRLPDGEYRTAYGMASVDGSDISMDSY